MDIINIIIDGISYPSDVLYESNGNKLVEIYEAPFFDGVDDKMIKEYFPDFKSDYKVIGSNLFILDKDNNLIISDDFYNEMTDGEYGNLVIPTDSDE